MRRVDCLARADSGAYAERVLRRRQLTIWLKHAVQPSYDDAKVAVAASKLPATDHALQEILVALSALRIEDAVQAAVSLRENQLAMMLTQGMLRCL